ncbi:RHS repeat-associated core domain-containing protein [Geitlerinema splendidum]|nr:RHS repeat-associated core domain-containing protein [Geitlerinema splendidum]
MIAVYQADWQIAAVTYDPWGEQLSNWNASSYRYLWGGGIGYRQTNKEWATHYVRARHYSFMDGTWTTQDPLWPQEPAYRYVGNRVTRAVDPSGMCMQIKKIATTVTMWCNDRNWNQIPPEVSKKSYSKTPKPSADVCKECCGDRPCWFKCAGNLTTVLIYGLYRNRSGSPDGNSARKIERNDGTCPTYKRGKIDNDRIIQGLIGVIPGYGGIINAIYDIVASVSGGAGQMISPPKPIQDPPPLRGVCNPNFGYKVEIRSTISYDVWQCYEKDCRDPSYQGGGLGIPAPGSVDPITGRIH